VCGYSKAGYNGDPMTLPPGSILEGRYAIGRVIGKGGFGMTYLAYDMKLECKVAVKEYYPRGLAIRNPGSTFVSVSDAESEVTFKEGAGKFYDEARLVAKFNGNPNIVSVYDFFYGNDTVYFTMGYLDGMTLKSYLKEYGVLSLAQAVYVAESVSNALMAAHSLNVLHRDISPDNIMVCKDGTVKLLDFGAARQVVTEGSQSLSVILKQGFAPLEQYQKKGKQGPWTDIYSLGATLYHALTLDILDDPMSRLEDDEEYSSNCHQIEDAFWQIIKKATALRIQDRYQDIFELKKELNGLPVKPEPLVEPDTTAEAAKQGPTAKAFGSTVQNADVMQKGRVSEEDAVGVTMPLQEDKEEVGMTMPLQESKKEVGMTMPLQESREEAGMTMPLQESKKEAGMEMPSQEEVGATVPLQAEEAGGTMPLLEEQDGKGAEAEPVPGRTAWYETKRGWIFEMLGMAAVQLVTIIIVLGFILEEEPYGFFYSGNRFAFITVITAAEGMIFFTLEHFCLQPAETGNRMISKKKKIILIMISVIVNIVIVKMMVQVRTSMWAMIIAVSAAVGGIAFALDTFILQPAEAETEKEQIKKAKSYFFVIMSAISIITAAVTLWHSYWTLIRGYLSVLSLMAILEEGILLVILDAVSIRQYSYEYKNLKKYRHGVQWNAILLYFSFAQMLLLESYAQIEVEIVPLSLLMVCGFTVIFLFYLKKSRICAVLISLFAISLLCSAWEWAIEENPYILMFAFLSLSAVWLTFCCHKAETVIHSNRSNQTD